MAERSKHCELCEVLDRLCPEMEHPDSDFRELVVIVTAMHVSRDHAEELLAQQVTLWPWTDIPAKSEHDQNQGVLPW